MNKRLTISLPDKLHQQLKKQVIKGKWSQFITQAIEAKVFEENLLSSKRQVKTINPAGKFLSWRDKLPKFFVKQVDQMIARGRM